MPSWVPDGRLQMAARGAGDQRPSHSGAHNRNHGDFRDPSNSNQVEKCVIGGDPRTLARTRDRMC